MMLYGLIGKSLKHSASPAIYQQFFDQEGRADCHYALFELAAMEELPRLLETHPELQGFNVTFPYKELIIPCLDHLGQAAEEIGAVNVVTVERSTGKTLLTGYNSDWVGFSESLTGEMLPDRALILGTGGAARAVAYALRKREVACQFVSRSGKEGALRYEDVSDELMRAHHLIVNCTPLGTAGLHEDELPPLPYQALSCHHYLYDLVYNPAVTPFLQQGIDHGCHIQNGMAMLHAQAELAWKWFKGNLTCVE